MRHRDRLIWLSVVLLLSASSFGQSLKPQYYVTDGPVYAVEKHQDRIYIGGDFSWVGPSTGAGVLLDLTTGFFNSNWPRVNGAVHAVISDGNAGFYIGGSFTAVGGVQRNGLAHILADGRVREWNPNVNGTVFSLLLQNDELYVGGEFTTVGGLQRLRVASVRTDNAQPTSWNPAPDGPVYALADIGRSIIVGGDFTAIAGVARNRLAEFDSLISVSPFNPNVNGPVYALQAGGNGIYVGGSFTAIGGRTRNNLGLVSYAGSVLGYDPSPNATVKVLRMVGNQLFAGGDFTFIAGAKRIGAALLSASTPVLMSWDPGLDGSVSDLQPFNDLVYLAGSFSEVGGQARRSLALVDTFGAVMNWNPSAGGAVNALTFDENRTVMFAGGSFGGVNGVRRDYLAALNVDDGKVAPWNPSANGVVRSISASGSIVYVAGSFTTIGVQQRSRLAAIDAFTATPTNWNPDAGGDVYTICSDGGKIYAGGVFSTVGVLPRNNVAEIDSATGMATAWNPNADNLVAALRVAGPMVYAGGYFGSIGGQPRNRVAALTRTTGVATSWNPNAGNAQSDIVNSLETGEGVVYTGGSFTSIGGVQRQSLAAIDSATGTATSFNANLDPFTFIDALSLDGGNLYAGGIMEEGQQAHSGLISVNPETGERRPWDPRVAGPVHALSVSDTTVFAGGSFHMVLNDSRTRLAAIVDPSLNLPSFALSRQSLDFGSVRVGLTRTDSVLVANAGGGILNITSVTSSSQRFTVVPQTAMLHGGESAWFFVTYSPNTIGTHPATINFNHNAPGGTSQLNVSGVGVASAFSVSPASLAFGSVVVKGSKLDSVTVTNAGSLPLTILSVTSSGAHFTVQPTSGQIGSLESRRFYITFSPTTTGNLGGTISFEHDAIGSPGTVVVAGTGVAPSFSVVPGEISFGDVKVGRERTDSVTVTNPGTSPLTILSAQVSGGDFSVDPDTVTVLPLGAEQFRVRFQPATVGEKFGVLVFAHNAFGSPDSVLLSGNGVLPVFQANRTSIAFGSVLVGTIKQDSVTVQNTGNAPLSISSVTSTSQRFSVLPPSAIIPASGSARFLVTFSPTSTIPSNGSIVFVHDGASSPTNVAVSGTGLASGFNVVPGSIAFGNVRVGTSQEDSLVVTNNGTAQLSITNVASSDPRFAVLPLSANIPPTGSRGGRVFFSPTTAGSVSGSVTFTHSAVGSPTIVAVSGSGVVPQFSVSPASRNFGNVVVNTTGLDSVLVSNNGGASLLVSSVTSSTEEFSVVPPSGLVPPSGNRWFHITFRPTSSGQKNATISFVHDAAGSPAQVSVSGAGVVSTIAIAPSVLSFGEVRFDTTRIDSFTVTNSGNFAITISSVTSGHGWFAVTPQSGTVPIGGSLKFYVTFQPREEGDVAASITLTHNAAGSPTSISVSGAGLVPRFQISRESVAFGSVRVGVSKQDTLSVGNPGNDTLRIREILFTDPRFTIVPSGARIPPSGSALFFVLFTPLSPGFTEGTATFHHDAPNDPFALSLSGTGIAPVLQVVPQAYLFGEVGVGNSADVILRISNSGTATLNVDSVRLRGAAAQEYAVVGSTGPFLPVGFEDTLRLTVRFSPQTVGQDRIAHLLIFSDAPTSPDSVLLSGDGRGSIVQVGISGDSTVGSSVTVNALPPEGFLPQRSMLYYRLAGRRSYDSLALSFAGQSYVATIPPTHLTIRGVEYFVAFSNSEERFTHPEINPEQNPEILRVKVPFTEAQLTLPSRRYSMMSLPLEVANPTAQAQLYDDYGTYDQSQWRLFRWEGGRYVEFDTIAARLVPGSAFWLVTLSGNGFDVGDGRSTTSGRPYQLTLDPGWNQVSVPFAFRVLWDSIAGSRSLRPPYLWDGVQFVPGVTTLEPWHGYFVYNDSISRVTISIPPIESGQSQVQKIAGAEFSSSDAAIQFSLYGTTDDDRDEHNYIGFLNGASVSDDFFDLPEPPSPRNGVWLAFREQGRSYLANFKPGGGNGATWNMVVASASRQGPLRVVMTKHGELPEGFGIYVLDTEAFTPIPITNGRFEIDMRSSTDRSFRVILGTKEFAEQQSGGIPLVPVLFSLEQNYPNPFNPSTRIGYALHEKSKVTLEVYDLLGRLIRTLVDDEQLTGRHSVEWNGTNTQGGAVASGVYLYRLRAGDKVATRKLLLLR